MNNAVRILIWTFFYFVPVLFLLLSKRFNRDFKAVGLTIKTVDLLVPYLVIMIHIYSRTIFSISWIPYYIIGISIIGIGLAILFTFKWKELTYSHFFRVWWRYVFIISIITFFSTGGFFMYSILV